MNKIQRALISVSHKTGIVDFAKSLAAIGVEILSIGGTAKLLAQNGVKVIEVSDYTGFPEMMDGRVKTLHPKIHGGILGRRGTDDGVMKQHNIGGGYMIFEVQEQERDAAGELVTKRILTGEEFEREMLEKHGEHFYRAGPCASRKEDPQKEPPTFLVTRWIPFEASVVPISADVDVGVGRSAGAEIPPEQVQNTPHIPHSERIQSMETPNKPLEGEAAERARVSAIATLGEQYAEHVNAKDIHDAIRNGRSVEQFKDTILAKMETLPARRGDGPRRSVRDGLRRPRRPLCHERARVAGPIRATTIGFARGRGKPSSIRCPTPRPAALSIS